MLYLDTSLIVASIVSENATLRVQHWLAVQEPEQLITSDWTITEFSSAMAMNVRTGRIDLQTRAGALTLFNRMVAQSLRIVAVLPEHFRAAANFADQHIHGVRAGDALHLATATAYGATLCTLDKRLAAAAPALGASAQLID